MVNFPAFFATLPLAESPIQIKYRRKGEQIDHAPRERQSPALLRTLVLYNCQQQNHFINAIFSPEFTGKHIRISHG